ncbi:MAG: hypothetical protein ACXVEF_31970 [Polyangiales bacterium]
MILIKALAVAALVCAPIGCIAQDGGNADQEAVASSSDAIMTAADLKDYGFTALYFSGDTLQAGLTITDPAGVPLSFTLGGVDAKGTNKVTTEVKLVSIDSYKKTAIYARVSGEVLGTYFNVLPNQTLTSKSLLFSAINYPTFIWNCYVERKPPGPPRCYIVGVAN